MEIRPAGRHGLLVELADSRQARALAHDLRAAGPAVREVVPAARTVLLDGIEDPAAVRRLLAAWAPATTEHDGGQVEVAVIYDGPDLAAVAEQLGWSVRELVARHTTATFVAEFSGFAPGFAYLSGWEVSVPRLATPRARVEPGSVALADRWCGVYPTASPGGWRVIGRTRAELWDVEREPPALLAPGTRVRFTEVPA